MHSNNQQNHFIGVGADTGNINLPANMQKIPGSITPANIQLPESYPQPLIDERGFTVENIQQPVPIKEPDLAGNDE